MTDPTHDNAMAGLVEPNAWLVEDLLKLNRPPIFATDCRRHVEGIYSDPAEFKITPLVPAAALEAATARADKAEAQSEAGWAQQRYWTERYRVAADERDAALSRVTEAKAEGMREAADIAETRWALMAGTTEQHNDRSYYGRSVAVTLRALAQSSGADPAQGGRDDG